MKEIWQWILDVNDKTKATFEEGLFMTLLVWLCIGVAAWILLHVIKRILKEKEKRGKKNTFPLLAHLIRALIYIIAVTSALFQIQPLKTMTVSLLATSGVLAVIIGLASQEAFSNLVHGLFISLFKPFVIGDIITIKDLGVTGVVEDINLHHTVLKTFQNNRVIVPNAKTNGSVIENQMLGEKRLCNYLDINIAYTADIDKAISLLRNLAVSHPYCVDARNPQEIASGEPVVAVRVVDLKDFGVALRAFIWSADSGSGFSMLCDLRKEIIKEFAAREIEIPFNTMNAVIKSKGGVNDK
ncbi:MAG TPA: mechanosensitive ion channel family protein [Oscillospiraceae bacterium]|nr:mechanosensitive ion channel family protein [Oscillospiraceae bacterium]HPS34985.1 mechanosensitive ion channel family protein [Oscillospiraceae bacterium]